MRFAFNMFVTFINYVNGDLIRKGAQQKKKWKPKTINRKYFTLYSSINKRNERKKKNKSNFRER